MDMPPYPDQAKRFHRMARVDAMSPELRACVHEFGLSVVDAFLQAGVTKPKHMRNIIRIVLHGSYQGVRDGHTPQAKET